MREHHQPENLPPSGSQQLKARDYWLQQLSGDPVKSAFPYDLPLPGPARPSGGATAEQRLSYRISPDLCTRLLKLSSGSEIRLFIVFLAVLTVLLDKYTGNEDLIVAAPIYRQEKQGRFLNTLLLLRNTIHGSMSFKELLLHTGQNLREAVEHQNYPLERLFYHLNLEFSGDEFPLTDVAILLENLHDREYIRHIPTRMTFIFRRQGEQIEAEVAYDPRCYRDTTIQLLANRYLDLMERLISDISLPLARVEWLSETEKRDMICRLHCQPAHYPAGKTITALFHQQVQQNPRRTAVVMGEHQGTYNRLDEWSQRWGGVLRQKGVSTGSVVGILLPHGPELPAVILGILRAGGVYMPMDVEYPRERLRFMLRDSGARFLVCESAAAGTEAWPQHWPGEIIVPEPGTLPPDTAVPYRSQSREPAYIIYTSGTTGQPKGVMIRHNNVVQLLRGEPSPFDFHEGDTWTLFHSYCFDFSVWEMYGALLYGGKLVVTRRMQARDPGIFLDLLKREKVTVLNQTPSAFYPLLERELQCTSPDLVLRWVIFGGEALAPARLLAWKQRYPATRLVNMFGITETTVHVTFKEIGPTEIASGASNIGKPLPRVTAAVTDRYLNLLPPGVSGELLVGGAGVGLGYVNRVELTARRFLGHSLEPERKKEQLYCSGDLVRLRDDGDMEYLGRRDHQVQVKGYRIEPEEIREQLLKYRGVREAVVIPRQDSAGDVYLCGYVVSDQTLRTSDLRDFLGTSLPHYMIPPYLLQVGQIPLTVNGKVDKAALPLPEVDTRLLEEYVPPSGPVQEKMVQIWQEVLKVEHVGIRHSYFNLGGDSIKAIKLLSRINRDFGSDLRILDLFTHDNVETLASQVTATRDAVHRQEKGESGLSRALAELEEIKNRVLPQLDPAAGIEDLYPMSDIQKGMVFHALKDPEAGVYHDQMVYPLTYPGFDPRRFREAVRLLVRKHAILRTAFNLEDFEEPMQLVYRELHGPDAGLPLHLYHLGGMTESRQQDHIRHILAEDRRSPLDITRAPLWRLRIFTLDPRRVVIAWSFHHAIMDGWSEASFMTELDNVYLRLQQEPGYQPDFLKSSYKDFVARERADKQRTGSLRAWEQELTGYQRLDLGREERPPLQGQPFYQFTADAGTELKKNLENLARTLNTSLKSLCLAAYIYSLSMLSHQEDLVVGLVTNNRPVCEDGENILGCFLNTVPVRFRFPPRLTWEQYLALLDQHLLEMKPHEHVSLFDIARQVEEETGSGNTGNPIFDTLFNFVDFHVYNQLASPAARSMQQPPGSSPKALPEGDPESRSQLLSPEEVQPSSAPEEESPGQAGQGLQVGGTAITNTLLDFSLNTTSGALLVAITSATSLASGPAAPERLYAYFRAVLNRIRQHPREIISRETLLSREEKQELLDGFNRTAASYPLDVGIHDFIRAQARQTPDQRALVQGEARWTYSQLDRRANHLARELRDKGIRPGDIVGIEMEPSPEMVAAILSILIAGGAYLPLAAAYPTQRKQLLLRDTGAAVLLTEGTAAAVEIRVRDRARSGPADPGHLPPRIRPAYVIYTSGSTGIPKGVAVGHSQVNNCIGWMQETFALKAGDGVLQRTPLNFDPSVWEIFWPLRTGAGVRLLHSDQAMDVELLLGIMAQDPEVAAMYWPASLVTAAARFLTLQPQGTGLKTPLLFTGAEPIAAETVQTFYRCFQGRIINTYGPTEGTINNTWCELPRKGTGSVVPIGRPVANNRVYIVSRHMQLLPPGVKGEICIAGASIALGYANRPEQTAAAFVKNPFGPGRLYKTGDLGKWRPDSTLEIGGRIDRQVKIRGYRIEVEEIRQRLLQHPRIGDAAVVLSPANQGDPSLTAYLVMNPPHSPFTAAEIREFLSRELPVYMIPAAYIPLPHLPLTSTGKLDVQALPSAPLPEEAVPLALPRDATGKQVADIWAEVLNRESSTIGLQTDFFTAGGHSLNAMVMIAKIRKAFRVKIPLQRLFRHPTLQAFCRMVDEASPAAPGSSPSLLPTAAREYYPLSPAQKRLFILYHLDPVSTGYNMPQAIPLPPGRDWEPARAEEILRRLIRRHESLRTSFHLVENQPVQQVRQRVEFNLEAIEPGKPERGETGPMDPAAAFIRPFDLSRAPLLRVGVFSRGEAVHVLVADLHHIIADGLSLGILMKEFTALYQGEDLTPLRLQYRDYACWEQTPLRQAQVQRQGDYWLNQFAGEIPVLNLPTDFPRPPRLTFAGHTLHFTLEADHTAALNQLARQEGTTLYMLLLAVFNVWLARLCNTRDLVTGTPVAGRQHPDLQGVIGMFVNTLPLRLFPQGDKPFRFFLHQVKDQCLEAFENQDYPFEELVERLQVPRDLSRSPLFDVFFLLHLPEDPLPDPAGRETGLPFYYQAARYDLSLGVTAGDRLRFTLGYRSQLFTGETMQGYAACLQQLLSTVICDADQPVSRMELLPAEARQQLLVELNDTHTSFPRELTLHRLVEIQTRKTPHRVALNFRGPTVRAYGFDNHDGIDGFNGYDSSNGSKGSEGFDRTEPQPVTRGDYNHQLSYGELDERARQHSGQLRAAGVGRGTLAALKMTRSLEMITGILAILKAGAAYLPIDNGSPPDRVRYLLAESRARLLLTRSNRNRWENQQPLTPVIPQGEAGPNDPAYVIYTSGSTGRPKGVLVEHHSAVNAVAWFGRTYGLSAGVHVLQLSDYQVDASIDQFFGTLSSGAALHIVPKPLLGDLEKLRAYIAARHIRVINFVPSFLSALLCGRERLKSLETVISGAERLDDHVKRELLKTGYRLSNHYGPTETTIEALAGPCSGEAVTLGRPIANVCCYILDSYARPVPRGAAGELVIGGEGVARGYLNNPELTAERFFSGWPWLPGGSFRENRPLDPRKSVFSEELNQGICRSEQLLSTESVHSPGGRLPLRAKSQELRAILYKTGDLGRWRQDRTIEFLGRIDLQVKVRGFRIEPGEVEKHLMTYPGITGAVVTARQDPRGDSFLCAYLVPAADREEGDASQLGSRLSDYLSQRLPSHMIPAAYVRLERLPLTPSGKIHHRALPAPGLAFAGDSQSALESSPGAIEARLAEIWAGVLGVEPGRIGLNSDFFRMGGQSLKATILASRIAREFNVEFSLTRVFQYPRLAGAAAFIRKSGRGVYRGIVPVEKREYYPQSSAQKRLFFLDQFEQIGTTYNMPGLFRLELDRPRDRETVCQHLEGVFRQLIARHESLRTSFHLFKQQPVQRIHEPGAIPFHLEHYLPSPNKTFLRGAGAVFSKSAPARRRQDLKKTMQDLVNPFDLSRAPLLRATLVRFPNTPSTLFLFYDLHHIICDGTSSQLLAADFTRLFSGGSLPQLRLQYKEFSSWQNRLFAAGQIRAQQQYWWKRFAGGRETSRLNLPTDFPRPAVMDFSGEVVRFRLSGETAVRFKNLGASRGATLYMNLLAAFNVLLHKYTGQEDILVGSGIMGRPHADLHTLIGMFINMIAMKNRVQARLSYSLLLDRVKKTSLEAFENQDLQFEELIDQLEVQRDPSRNPLVDVTFVVQNFEPSREPLARASLQLEPLQFENKISKFDMTLFCREQGDEISFMLEYCTALFKRETVATMVQQLLTVITAVAANPDLAIMDIDIVSPRERRLLLEELNATRQDYPAGKTLPGLLEELALGDPDRVILVEVEAEGAAQLTYREFNERANRLARYLIREKGLRPEEPVGVIMDRSIQLPMAWLSILKAGGAYVPLDPGYPEERLKRMIAGADIGLVLGQTRCIKILNRLQWECPAFHTFLCPDSQGIYNETEAEQSGLMDEKLWEYVAESAVDDITGGGWLTSTTGQPFSRREMDEYGDNVLIKLKPLLHRDMRVMEIGCASGITMFRLAPLVGFYYGTDLSRSTIEKNRQLIREKGMDNIQLAALPAHLLHRSPERGFHLVIINSVIQSFHGHNYLRAVLRQVVDMMAPRGAIFIGDIMDLERKPALVRYMSGFKEAHPGEGYQTKLDWSEELFISRQFLEDLKWEIPGLQEVQCSPKIHTLENELTLFRYDALLRVDKDRAALRAGTAAPGTKHKHQEDSSKWSGYPAENPGLDISSSQLAYVIHTSGSTGQPKGVMVTHGNVVRTVRESSITEWSRESALLPTGAAVFDISTFEIWAPLLNQARLVLANQETILNGPSLAAVLRAHHVTHLHLIPQLFNQLAAQYPGLFATLAYFLVGGDRVHPLPVNEIRQRYPRLQIRHMYGPTENTTFSTFFPVDRVEEGSLPIGRPLANSTVFILDEQQRLQPVGAVGELYVGGSGLARGYINNPELTAEKFVPYPYSLHTHPDNTNKSFCGGSRGAVFSKSAPLAAGGKLYRTGDLARWSRELQIRFMGRKDRQVKVRGFRIESAEIENQLLECSGIEEAVVISRSDKSGDPELCAYVTVNASHGSTPEPTELKQLLAGKLPGYMLPGHIVVLEKIPLLPNGKMDLRSLPEPVLKPAGNTEPPQGEVEETLARIWSEILDLDLSLIGAADNFFQLGGHSLKVTLMVAAIHKRLNIKVPIAVVFKNPFIRELGLYIESRRGDRSDTYRSIQAMEDREYYELSYSQRRLWFLFRAEPRSPMFNLRTHLAITGPLDLEKVHRILPILVKRHESFRTYFREVTCRVRGDQGSQSQGQRRPVQVVLPALEIPVELEDLSHLEADALQEKRIQWLEAESATPFDLRIPPLVRLKVLKCREDRYDLLFTMHHILSDGWSMEVLEQEFHRLYREGDKVDIATSPALPPLQIRYRDYVQWHNRLLEEEKAMARAASGWKHLENGFPRLNLPYDYPAASLTDKNSSAYRLVVPEKVTAALRQVALECRASLFMVLLTAFNILWARVCGQQEILIAAPGAARQHDDLKPVIGFFVNTLVLHHRLNHGDTFRDFLAQVQENTLHTLEYQSYPLELLCRRLNLRYPELSVFFNMSGFGSGNRRELTHRESVHIPRVPAAKFEIVCYLVEYQNAVEITTHYYNGLFKPITIEKILQRYLKILAEVTDNPRQILSAGSRQTGKTRRIKRNKSRGIQDHAH